MNEKRFSADDVVCIMIWRVDADGGRYPCFRIYDPKDSETGGARKKPDGSFASFKDYRLRTMVDPSIRITETHGCFEFVETEEGECYFDFSLKALGKSST